MSHFSVRLLRNNRPVARNLAEIRRFHHHHNQNSNNSGTHFINIGQGQQGGSTPIYSAPPSNFCPSNSTSSVQLVGSSISVVNNNTIRRRLSANYYCHANSNTNHIIFSRCLVGITPSDDFKQIRNFCTNPSERPKKGFLGNLVDNIKEEMQKNKELEENLKKLKAETERLEQSEALQKAREKYQLVERETFRSSQILKEKLEELKSQLSKTLEEAKSTEFGKRTMKYGEDVAKTAKEAAEALSKSAEALSSNPAYKTVAESMKTVKEEIDEITLSEARLYKRPELLKKRQEHALHSSTRTVEPNEHATGMVLTKESKFYAKWKNFMDNNPYLNKFLEFKMKYEESDSKLARVSRFFTEKISDAVSAVFSQTNVSEVLTEVKKVDPSFDNLKFLRQVELEIIPNVLEASLGGNLEVLKDWCYERAYAQMSLAYTECKRAGYRLRYSILDVNHVTIEGGEMSDSGPVLAVVFRSQQIRYIETPEGKVIEGDPNQLLMVNHVWALCRDVDEINPKAAWKILEAAESAKPMLL